MNSKRFKNLVANTPKITKTLITINLIVFVIQLIPGFNDIFGLRLFTSDQYHWYQVLIHMFMHGGIFHLFFNMLALYFFGSHLENRMSVTRYLMLYFYSGIGSVILHNVIIGGIYGVTGDGIMIGASGAVFGLFAAYCNVFPNRPLSFILPFFNTKAKKMFKIYVALELILGILHIPGDNIAHFAHLGGALTGYVIVRYYTKHLKWYR